MCETVFSFNKLNYKINYLDFYSFKLNNNKGKNSILNLRFIICYKLSFT